MKTFKNLLLFILVSVVGFNTAVYAGNNDKTELRQVKNFNGIKVSTGIDLYITMGNSEEVKIVADDEIIDDIITEVKDGTLHIYMKKNNWFNWGNFNQSRKAYVSVKELLEIDASSGSDVRSENTLEGESIKIEASSGSDVELNLVYKNISLNTSSGSDAKLEGRAKTFKAEASSGSDINAGDLETSICQVRVSSGSDAIVNVTDELYARASSGADVAIHATGEIYANASSGADVNYYGNPSVKNIDESSGGDVSQR